MSSAGHDADARKHIDQLFADVYRELHDQASRQMARERRGHTLQPTALIGEVYVKLCNQGRFQPTDREHFLRLASQAMRQVLIDFARRRNALRRAGERVDVDLDLLARTQEGTPEDCLAVHQALERLATEGPKGERQARLVELVWFVGLSFSEAAEQLGVDRRTATRDWAYARVWLEHELSDATGPSTDPAPPAQG